MLHIESLNKLTITSEGIRNMDASRVSDPEKFLFFASGIAIDDNFLFNDRWSQEAVAPQHQFHFIFQEMLPAVLDVNVVDQMGGHVGIRITDVADFTVLSVNDRVITLTGLPQDVRSGSEVMDIEIAPDVFMGFCRGLLLETADEILEADDEYEDRVVSDAELVIHGMPAGGFRTSEEGGGSDSLAYGFSQVNNDGSNVGTVNADGVFRGVLNAAGDRDMVAVYLREGETYQIAQSGASTGDGTLSDTRIYGVYDVNGVRVHVGDDDGGVGYNSQLDFTASYSGVHYVQAGSYGDNRSGTYELSVANTSGASGSENMTVLNMSVNADRLSVAEAAGSDALAQSFADINDDLTNVGTVNRDGVFRGVLNAAGDRDMVAVYLREGETYQIAQSGASTGDGTLSDTRIYGVYDSNGVRVHAGDDDGGVVYNSQLDFTASYSGVHYVQAGSYGDNRSGTYELSVANTSGVSDTGNDLSAVTINAPNGAYFDCVPNYSAVGANASITGVSACAANASANGVNARITGVSACAANASANGVNASITGVSACAANASANGVNASITGVSGCAANASANGVNASITGISGCAANASANGVNASITGISGCAANASANGVDASITGISGCAANASLAGVNTGFTPISSCAANATIGGVSANLYPRAAYVVACGVDLGGGVDFGVCAINIMPLMPSC